ncbi:MAG TPA: LptA/OstA family protein [Candidatus Sulfotelmatobacter sp.]|nr:LptA/OstA family protein [Candidatus Sulfotelmatobacter sp.]
MPLPIYRLRRWLVAIAVIFTLVVAGMYLRVRLLQRNVLKGIPGKIGYDIKQTAAGFQYSQSDGKRTLFTIQASDLKEFKLNGRTELHKVSIVLYGRDSSRFDRIYGDDFSYDPKSGDVIAKGDVQIDLEANPSGRANPDQSIPKELRSPIHLKTRDLVFNRETGNATTAARVEFRTSQAAGSAVGVQYAGKTNTLTLASQVHLETPGDAPSIIEASQGLITGEPREILLEHPNLRRGDETLQADQAKLFLSADNNVDRIAAIGNVEAQLNDAQRNDAHRNNAGTTSVAGHDSAQEQTSQTHVHSDEAEFLLTGKQNRLRTATLTGHVEFERAGAQPMLGSAGRVVLDYSGQNQLQKVHALDNVRLTQTAASHETAAAKTTGPQDFVLAATAVDFFLVDGRFIDHAETSGQAQITIFSAQVPAHAGPTQTAPASIATLQTSTSSTTQAPSQTTITAGKFNAKFDTVAGASRLTAIHGSPNARIVNQAPGQPTRVSTSEAVDATFLPRGGIAAVTQQGNITYADDQSPDKRTQAWAGQARYTPVDQMLELSGSPRVVEGGMATTAKTIRINRTTGEALADGDVKSTYSELQEQPNGSLLASSSPIHVTARSMTARNHPAIAVYSGGARLWQDANVVEAPTIQFDRENRSLLAQGTPARPVSTILVQPDLVQPDQSKVGESRAKPPKKPGAAGKSAPPSLVAITAAKLSYADAERKAHYEGGVSAKSSDFTASSQTMDVYLLPRNQSAGSTASQSVNHQSVTGQSRVDRVVAQGHVLVQQPNRRAEGETLVYTTADDKFVLTGGPPSIFDAEQGKITGVSLTFFRADDRVLVEGAASTPVVTQTRVAR